MDKLKYIKIEDEDGNLSDNIPIGADAKNIDTSSGLTAEEELSLIKDENKTQKEQIEALQNQIKASTNGSPLAADSISEMTDTSRIYVNTTDGYWYYYNNGEWTKGGVYQAEVNPDIFNISKADYTASRGVIKSDGSISYVVNNSYVSIDIPTFTKKIKLGVSSYQNDYGYCFTNTKGDLLLFQKTSKKEIVEVDIPNGATTFKACWKDADYDSKSQTILFMISKLDLMEAQIDKNTVSCEESKKKIQNVIFKKYSGAVSTINGSIDYSVKSNYFTCINCEGSKKIRFNGSAYLGNYGICFYNINGDFIESTKVEEERIYEINIPQDAKFARLSWKEETKQSIQLLDAPCNNSEYAFPIFNNEDITKVLQEMIDNSKYGDKVIIPKGIYYISTKIIMKSGISIKGAGSRYTVFKDLTPDGNADTIFGVEWHDGISDEISDIEYTDFCIDRSSCTCENVATKGIYVQGIHNSKFERLVFIKTPATALGTDYLDSVIINEVECYDCGHKFNIIKKGCSGIGIGTGKWKDESWIVSNCITKGCGQAGIFVETQFGLKYKAEEVMGRNQTIIGNICKNNNYGILMDGGSSINITGNIFSENTFGIGWKHFGSNINVSGNTFYLNDVALQNQNSTPATEDAGIFITGNLIHNSKVACEFIGLFVAIITNNVIKNNITKCATLSGNFQNKFVWTNNFTDGNIDKDNATNLIVE